MLFRSGLMFLVTMLIFRLPYAMLISVLITFTALIPIVGAFIGCFIGVLLIAIVSPIQSLWFLILFLILQQIEEHLIYPRVVGNSVGLPAIWVLVAFTVGGKLYGVVGMLVFIPLCSVLYALLRDSVHSRLGLEPVEHQVDANARRWKERHAHPDDPDADMEKPLDEDV